MQQLITHIPLQTRQVQVQGTGYFHSAGIRSKSNFCSTRLEPRPVCGYPRAGRRESRRGPGFSPFPLPSAPLIGMSWLVNGWFIAPPITSHRQHSTSHIHLSANAWLMGSPQSLCEACLSPDPFSLGLSLEEGHPQTTAKQQGVAQDPNLALVWFGDTCRRLLPNIVPSFEAAEWPSSVAN